MRKLLDLAAVFGDSTVSELAPRMANVLKTMPISVRSAIRVFRDALSVALESAGTGPPVPYPTGQDVLKAVK